MIVELVESRPSCVKVLTTVRLVKIKIIVTLVESVEIAKITISYILH